MTASIALVASLLLVVPSTANAAETGPGTMPTAVFTPDTVCLGSELTVHGAGWGAGELTGFWIDGSQASGNLLTEDAWSSTVRVAEDGTFSASWGTRADAEPGLYTGLSFQLKDHVDSMGRIDVSVTAEHCGPLTAATPTISGSAIVGSVLTAKAGTWTSGTTLKYQWLANGTAIGGATASTYTVTSSRSGQRITVAVTGSKSGYATTTKTSAGTAYVMRPSTPTISGTFAYGSTLTVKPNTWTSGTTFTYQWLANGKAISGATKSTLKLGSAQKATQISVKVTGKKSGHPTVAKTSSKSAKVLTAGSPWISGTRAVGSTLTAKTGTWTASTTYRYQWYANGSAISGATKSTFKLGSAQANDRITVKVTGKRSGYATVAKTSSNTTRIMKIGSPSISGSAVATKKLTAKPGTWSTGTKFSYQWYANGSAISGATRSTYTISSKYVGKRISLKIKGSQSGYTTFSKTAASTGVVKSGTARPVSDYRCPSGWPIKGNQTTRHTTDWIYHVPGGAYYSVTKPEQCFATGTAAKQAGYRESYR